MASHRHDPAENRKVRRFDPVPCPPHSRSSAAALLVPLDELPDWASLGIAAPRGPGATTDVGRGNRSGQGQEFRVLPIVLSSRTLYSAPFPDGASSAHLADNQREATAQLDEVDGMAWTRARRRWAWALVLVPAALALMVLTTERRHEPAPLGTPVDVRLEDFKVRQDAAVVPAGTVSFRILNQGPTSHELIVVRTERAPDKLPLQRDGLTVNEDAPGIDLLDEADGLDIDDRQTLVLRMAPGHYVLYCNYEGHYLGGMYAALTVR
jgi:uncharacterized cupredoxin-like copper-binding protein